MSLQLAVDEEIILDKGGRMVYHKDFHHNHGKSYTKSDYEYLCKYWEVDHYRTMAFALGRPEASVVCTVLRLKKEGLYDYYKNLGKHW